MLANFVELTCIALAGAVTWFLSPYLPRAMGLGYILNFSAALFLAQGFVRDVTILYRSKKRASPQDAETSDAAICLESSLGIMVIIVGAVLMIGAWGPVLDISRVAWPITVMGIMLFGWACKDIVIKFRPLRLAVEKDHANVRFTWKKDRPLPPSESD